MPRPPWHGRCHRLPTARVHRLDRGGVAAEHTGGVEVRQAELLVEGLDRTVRLVAGNALGRQEIEQRPPQRQFRSFIRSGSRTGSPTDPLPHRVHQHQSSASPSAVSSLRASSARVPDVLVGAHRSGARVPRTRHDRPPAAAKPTTPITAPTVCGSGRRRRGAWIERPRQAVQYPGRRPPVRPDRHQQDRQSHQRGDRRRRRHEDADTRGGGRADADRRRGATGSWRPRR